MKKLFALLLALCLLLTFAACGEPEESKAPNNDKPGATKPNPSVELVTAYETESSSTLGSFRMDFTYDETYRSGTAVLTKDGEDISGTFTCDENYNINHMDFTVDEEGEVNHFLIDCTFDDAHRLLTAKVLLRGEKHEVLRYSAEYKYDSEGRNVYSKLYLTDTYMSTTTVEYREDGQILKQTTELQVGGNPAQVSVVSYTYDEQGYIKSMAMSGGEGTLPLEYPATYEVKEDGVHYTMERDTSTLCLVVDENGKIILQDSYGAGELISSIKTEYNEAGQVIRMEQRFPQSNTTTVVTYSYTPGGRMQEQKQTANGAETIIQRTTFQTAEIPN